MNATSEFPLLLISAWNDSGGGFTHRLFDGHPECLVLPFELQLGTGIHPDGFADWFHAKYRWPVLPICDEPEAIFDLIIDDEVKGRLLSPKTSKFKDFALDLDLQSWRRDFAETLPTPFSRADVVRCYVDRLLDNWHNRLRSDEQWLRVGHCPNIVLDADAILQDFPRSYFLHIIRNPLAGLADMRRRRPEVVARSYALKWSLINGMAYAMSRKYPDRVRLLGFFDLMSDRRRLAPILEWLGLVWDARVTETTWNGQPIPHMGPFGGVPVIDPAHEIEAANSLDASDRDTVLAITAGTRAMIEDARINIPFH